MSRNWRHKFEENLNFIDSLPPQKKQSPLSAQSKDKLRALLALPRFLTGAEQLAERLILALRDYDLEELSLPSLLHLRRLLSLLRDEEKAQSFVDLFQLLASKMPDSQAEFRTQKHLFLALSPIAKASIKEAAFESLQKEAQHLLPVDRAFLEAFYALNAARTPSAWKQVFLLLKRCQGELDKLDKSWDGERCLVFQALSLSLMQQVPPPDGRKLLAGQREETHLHELLKLSKASQSLLEKTEANEDLGQVYNAKLPLLLASGQDRKGEAELRAWLALLPDDLVSPRTELQARFLLLKCLLERADFQAALKLAGEGMKRCHELNHLGFLMQFIAEVPKCYVGLGEGKEALGFIKTVEEGLLERKGSDKESLMLFVKLLRLETQERLEGTVLASALS